MRMSNEEFTKQVLRRANDQIEQRRQTIQKRVKIGAFCALAAMICSPVVLKGFFYRNAATSDTATMESPQYDDNYAAGDASSEECAEEMEQADEEAPAAEGGQNLNVEHAGKDRGKYNGNNDLKTEAEAEESSAEEPDYPDTNFAEMTEAEVFAYYGISGLPEQIGGLQLVTERSEDVYGSSALLGIKYADEALTVPYDDYNLWVYSDGTQKIEVLLGKAQDGINDTVIYAEAEEGETASFSNGSVYVLASDYNMTHDRFAAAVEELKTALAQ